MKYIVSITTVLFVLLTSSVSWGGVDGKGVICGEKQKWFGGRFLYPTIYKFRDGFVKFGGFTFKNDKIIHTEGTSVEYELSSSTISWEVGSFMGNTTSYKLNRKNLRLKMSSIDPINCKVYSEVELMKQINIMIKEFQKELDESLNENKL
jgi:hypothetical protein